MTMYSDVKAARDRMSRLPATADPAAKMAVVLAYPAVATKVINMIHVRNDADAFVKAFKRLCAAYRV